MQELCLQDEALGEKTADKKDSITVLVESGSPAEALAKETAADFKRGNRL